MSTSKSDITPVSIVTNNVSVVAIVTAVCVHVCRDCPDVRMDELKPFSVPLWMVEKMQRAMEAQRDADL